MLLQTQFHPMLEFISRNLGIPGPAAGRHGLPRSLSSSMIASAVDKLVHAESEFKKAHVGDEIRLYLQVVEMIGRQQYLIKLRRGLMLYERLGAWANRLATPR